MYPIPNTPIFLIDTPGFDDPLRSDTEILQSIVSCLADMYEGLTFADLKVDLAGTIYMQSIHEARITGSTMTNLEMLRSLIGEENMEHCVLVTSKWGCEDRHIAQQRESELVQTKDYWGWFLAAGAGISRYQDNRTPASEIIEQCIRAGEFTPWITREYILEGMQLVQTTAGRAVDLGITEARERNRKELDDCRAEYKHTLELAGEGAAAESRALMARAEVRMKTMDLETERLYVTRDEAQKRMDEDEKIDWYTETAKNPVPPTSSSTASLSHSSSPPSTTPLKRSDTDRRRARRATTLGAAVGMVAASGGAIMAVAPIAIGAYTVVEAVCQADKSR
ncbi:MAG: hypothetical protein LQ346_005318 [Caloplaca aetnensis]|nr:MAG: hypothetical protein LQ346_005318 [Caloplaca aetnensis]